MSFYLSFFLFILSLIAGLALMIAGKDMRKDKFLLLAAFHAIFLFAYIASLLLKKSNTEQLNNYFFTAYICSGLVFSGIVWRTKVPGVLRIYFTIFALTIPIFLISPSRLLNFLLTSNFTSGNGQVYHLSDKFYLERQNSNVAEGQPPHYKVILKKGMFHQTVQRDIVFNGKIDSVKVLNLDNETMNLRGYCSTTTYVSTTIDSSDVIIKLNSKKTGTVEYRL